ncbi:hypothetical protein MMC25_002219 [Agyrium rufum]|nr:hypothetical protein [Agyrium rufum]
MGSQVKVSLARGLPVNQTHPSPESYPILPYTTGLTGVNVPLDNISSHALWSSIAFLFIVIIIIRLGQQLHAHLRHMKCLSTTAAIQQRYFMHDPNWIWPALKKALIYAPLRHKRHNREIQLSKAISVGTIPSRLHTLILSFYLLSNIIYCCLLSYGEKNKAALIAEARGRTGHLAVVNMVGLFVLAGRNNPLIGILRVSFDTFNLFHRWIGRVVVLQAIAHTACWIVNEIHAKGHEAVGQAILHDPFITWGFVSLLAMGIILFQSPSAVRHAFYETFLHLHQFLAFIALLGIFYHAKIGPLPQMPYVIAIIIIWSNERFWRWARIIYRNVSLTRGCTTVTVEALPGDACRVTFDLKRPWQHRPGCHVYVYLPTISFWQSHPFSIAWSETRTTPYLILEKSESTLSTATTILPSSTKDLATLSRTQTTTSVSLVISKRTGMTAALFNRANAAPKRTLRLTGFLEGPYGGLESLHSYGTVLLFAGGVGITHQIGQVRDLLAAHANHTAAIRKIVLIWTIRSVEQMEWVRPWMDEILAMEGRRDVLRVEVFVTKPKNTKDVVSGSERVKMFAGRVKSGQIVRREFEEREGAMCVGVCGPGALADDVRAGVREVVTEGKVDFWEEGFTW